MKNINNIFFFMKFKSYTCVFIGKMNEIHIIITEKSIREIPEFLKKHSRINPEPKSQRDPGN